MMARAKRIYILMVEVKKFIFFFALWYFLKEIENIFFMFLLSYRNTGESLGELKKLWKHSLAARVRTAFLVLSKFHLCFYNSIETRYVFYFLNNIYSLLILIYVEYRQVSYFVILSCNVTPHNLLNIVLYCIALKKF